MEKTFNRENRIKEGPSLYKVIYQGNVYGVGVLTKLDTKSIYSRLTIYNYANMLANASSTDNQQRKISYRFSPMLIRRTTCEADVIKSISTLEEGIALLQGLHNSKAYYNRKKKELVEKKNI